MNLGDNKFSDIAYPAGCDEIEESRAVAIADLDKDGKLDIVIANNDAPPTIYLNRMPGQGNYFRCRLLGDPGKSHAGLASSRDAVGARVEVDIVVGEDRKSLVRLVEAGAGYAAQSEYTLHFGLGKADAIEEIRVAWPNGETQTIPGTQVERPNGEWVIEQGRSPVRIEPPSRHRPMDETPGEQTSASRN